MIGNYSTTKRFSHTLKIPFGQESLNKFDAFGGLRLRGLYKDSCKTTPLISVITVVFNGANYIEDAIKSVINQNYDNVEYIIIDGGSTDGTLEIIKKYEDVIDFWGSGKDGGIYDAMNIGINHATGDLISILNADDYFYDDHVLSSAAQVFSEDKFIAGKTVFETSFGSKEFVVDESRPEALNIPFIHTATLIPSSIYKAVGLYDTTYRIAADIEMFFRIKRHGFSYVNIDRNVVLMRDGGASHKHFKIGRKEYKNIYFKYNSGVFFKGNYYYLYSLLEFYAYNNVFLRKVVRFFKRGS